MVLKLIMPAADPFMRAGSVLKWYKEAGDRVEYGDDILDLQVEVARDGIARTLEQKIRLLKDGEALDRRVVVDRPMMLLVRLTASDSAILRTVSLAEGAHGEVGQVLGILTTEEDGQPASMHDQAVTSTFRVVTNLIG